jgi:hypothetical protein
MTEDDIRALLREMRDEPPPADALARVRLAVLERIRAGTWTEWFIARWKVFSLGGIMAMILLTMLLYRPVPPSPPAAPSIPSVAKVEEPTPIPSVRQQSTKARVSSKAKPRMERPRKPASTGEDVLVRIETADPDVVILLIGD